MELTISEVSKKYDVSISTLHYYEKEALLNDISKNESGNRKYNENNLQWLELIMCMRQAGMSVKEIKNYVALCDRGQATIMERYEIIKNKKKDIEMQMEQLEKSYKKICEKEQYYIDSIGENIDVLNPSNI